jgi:TIR domain
MARLFLSYRRDDSGAYADRLAQRLRAFQFDTVFLDRDGIALGEDYAQRIRTSLSQSAAVLVLIGKTWVHAMDDGGRRRLDDPSDWVRREVALALTLGLPVIPVLFDSARMPAVEELPAELATLATKQCYEISANYFDRDADDLARRLEASLVAADARRAAVPQGAAAIGFLRQLLLIWIALSLVTGGVAVAPSFVPALPQTFWLFPCSMTGAAFLWWLYWLGESMRPARARLA